MRQITNLDKGYRVLVCSKSRRVEGYELGNSSFPAIFIYSDGIQTSQSLPVNLDRAAALVELYGRCIEEYRMMLAEEIYSQETLE